MSHDYSLLMHNTVTECYNVLQCVAVFCIVLQCAAVNPAYSLLTWSAVTEPFCQSFCVLCVRACACMCVCVHVHMCVLLSVYMYVYIIDIIHYIQASVTNIYIYLHTYISIYIYMYMNACMHACMT